MKLRSMCALALSGWAVMVAAQEQPIVFGNDTLVDFSAGSGEPFIKVGPKGSPIEDDVFVTVPFGLSTTVSLLWKSVDGGASFIPLGSPITRDAVTGPGGGDTAVDFDAMGRVYYTDLSAACVMTAVSEDGGNTFLPDRTNHLTCIGGGENIEGVTDDRQWVAAFGDGLGYVTARNFAASVNENFHLFRTRDAGRTWTGQPVGSVSQSGPLAIDKVKRTVNGRPAILLYQIAQGLKMFRITDFDDGTVPTVEERSVVSTGNTLFPVLSVDTAGNLYVVWSNGGNIYLRTSQNRGDTWSATTKVNSPAMTGTNIMPWIVAGDAGRIDVIWYRTAGANNASSNWNLYFAQSLNALSANPTFTEVKASQTTIHKGEICLDGLNCDISTLAGSPRDRGFLEFPSIDTDSRGAAVMTFNDNTNQADGPGRPGGTYVMVARQTAGPSLYTSVGTVGADPGTVAITAPANGAKLAPGTVTLTGTHTLPAAGRLADAAGDALFPDHGPAAGLNVPALDLRGVNFTNDADSLTVTFDLADATLPSLLTAPAQSGGDGVLYLAQWDYNDTVYWVGAEVRGGQPVFSTGALGVIKSSTSKKYVTYNPDLMQSRQVTGSFSNTAPGTLSLRIPRNLVGSPGTGAQLHSATAYTMSQRGPLVPIGDVQGNPNPASLPVQVDATAPFMYRIDAPAGGIVEVAMDAAFTNPMTAVATGDGRWSLALANVGDGSHSAYVRQRINGRQPSAAAATSFSVGALAPDAFNFVERTGVATAVYVTSETRALTGFASPLAVSVTANGQYRLNSGSWTSAPGQASAGDTIAVRHLSATSAGTATETAVTVGGYTTVFRSVTSATDRTPDAFGFETQSGVELSTPIESNVVTPANYNAAASVTAGPGASFRINGGAWVTSGTINPGETLQTKHTSSASNLGYTKTYVRVGGVTGYFTTRTK